MSRFFEKILSPVLYAGALIPAVLAVRFTMFLLDRLVSFSGLRMIFLLTIVAWSLIFWLANKALTILEGSIQPTVGDHYRQSAACYAVALMALINLNINRSSNTLGQVVLAVVLISAMWAIIINAVYVYRQSRIVLVTPQLLVSPVGIKPQYAKIGLSVFVGPVFILLLMAVGYYVRQMPYRAAYLEMNPPPRVASPNDPPPPADLQSMLDKLPTSTIINNTPGLPLPSPNLDYERR